MGTSTFSLLVGLLGTVALAAAPPARDDEQVAAAREAFAALSAHCAADGGALWGASLAGPVLLVDRTTRRCLANVPDGAGRLVEHDGLWLGTVPDDVPLANTSADWSGTSWATVLFPLPADPFARDRLLLHESFHRLQPALGLPVTDLGNDHLDEEDSRVLLRLELRALATALRADGEARTASVADALAFRAAREAAHPGAGEHEASLEAHEGVAEYTGTRLACSSLEQAMTREAATLADWDDRDSYVRSFAYATGPALGLLLDAAGDDWRPALAKGARLHERLARAYGVTIAPDDLTPEAIDARTAAYGGEQIRAEEAARAETRRARLAADRARFVDGPVLLLPLRDHQRTFDPHAVRPLPGAGTIYGTVTIHDVWGTLEVTSGGCLITADFRAALLPAPTAIDGQHVTGDGYTLTLTGTWHTTDPRPDGSLSIQE